MASQDWGHHVTRDTEVHKRIAECLRKVSLAFYEVGV